MFVLYIPKTIFVSGLILFRSIEIVSLWSFPLRHSSPFESIGNSDKSPGMKVDLVVLCYLIPVPPLQYRLMERRCQVRRSAWERTPPTCNLTFPATISPPLPSIITVFFSRGATRAYVVSNVCNPARRRPRCPSAGDWWMAEVAVAVDGWDSVWQVSLCTTEMNSTVVVVVVIMANGLPCGLRCRKLLFLDAEYRPYDAVKLCPTLVLQYSS